jgi:adenylosuccinate synthase
MIKFDVVIGIASGDESKGKICYDLLKNNENYSHVVRYSGGQNTGTTIYHNGERFHTHIIPSAVFFNKPALIGPGCVFNISKMFDEIIDLEKKGIEVRSNLKIANNAHIISTEHIREDSKDTKIGTTKSGNGPAYRDKHARKNKRAEDFDILKEFLVDSFDYLDQNASEILFQGSQGHYLDIDHTNDYPYCTSATVTVGGVFSSGVAPQTLRNVYGVCKTYETYSGFKKFQNGDPALNKLQEIGEEWGVTTGRKRQCNWLNWDNLVRAIKINGVTDLIVNKCDIIEQLGVYKIIKENSHVEFKTFGEMKDFILCNLPATVQKTRFSYNPYTI